MEGQNTTKSHGCTTDYIDTFKVLKSPVPLVMGVARSPDLLSLGATLCAVAPCPGPNEEAVGKQQGLISPDLGGSTAQVLAWTPQQL